MWDLCRERTVQSEQSNSDTVTISYPRSFNTGTIRVLRRIGADDEKGRAGVVFFEEIKDLRRIDRMRPVVMFRFSVFCVKYTTKPHIHTKLWIFGRNYDKIRMKRKCAKPKGEIRNAYVM